MVGLCIHLLHWAIGNSEQLSAAIWVPIFIVGSLCVMSITQAAAIGKSIGGALCTSSGASMLSGFISNSMRTPHGLWKQLRKGKL